MKKISILLAACAALMGFSACNETWDDNPVLNTHEGVKEANFLNDPVMQNMPIMITSANRDGSFHLTCSQPDFGYAAAAAYKVQVSLDAAFGNYKEINQQFADCSEINPLNSDVASIIEELAGVKSESDLPLPYQKVYMRLRAYVPQSEANTVYLSNIVYFDAVAADYLAIWVSDVPVNLFIRGAVNDWGGTDLNTDPNLPGPWQFVTGATENTWILRNVTIPANVSVKVSTANWSGINLGGNAGENDDSQMVKAGEIYQMTGGDNPGHMRLTENFTGDVHLSLEAGQYFILFDPAH